MVSIKIEKTSLVLLGTLWFVTPAAGLVTGAAGKANPDGFERSLRVTVQSRAL